MREILFRGQHVDSKDWCYGYLVKQFGATQLYLSRSTAHSWDRHHVIPETVGQFTGLTDKNGTKIFEGDIVKFKHGGEFDKKIYYRNYAVEFINSYVTYGLRLRKGRRYLPLYDCII